MTAQNLKKKFVGLTFGVFESQLTPNPTNQDSQLSWLFQNIWNFVRKSKNMGLQGIISV